MPVTVECVDDSVMQDFFHERNPDAPRNSWANYIEVEQPKWQEYLDAMATVYRLEEEFKSQIK